MIPITRSQRFFIVILMLLAWIGLVGFTPTPAPLTVDRLVELANLARASAALPPLAVDPDLMRSAQFAAQRSAGLAAAETAAPAESAADSYGGGEITWTAQAAVVLPAGANAEMLIAEWASGEGGIPILSPEYRLIGVGAAVSADGCAHYVIIAAYTSGVTARAEAFSETQPPEAGSSLAAAARSQVDRPGQQEPIVPITGAQPSGLLANSGLLSQRGLFLPLLAAAAVSGLLLVYFALKS